MLSLCSSRGALLCHAGRTRRVRPCSSRLERNSLGTLNADLQGYPRLAFYVLIVDHGVCPEDAQVELVALSTGLVSQRRDANRFASLVCRAL